MSNRGIEANPEKIKAITSLAKPACVNDVQRLAGRIAALSRFISRLGEGYPSVSDDEKDR